MVVEAHDPSVTVDIYESLRLRLAAMDSGEPEPEPPTEPLTDKEREILRYLRGTLYIEEIAALMHVSANTTRTHVKNIYRKLGVNSRRDAVRLSYSLL